MFNYEYSKMFIMKIDMSFPDYKSGESIVWQDFNSVLESIKIIDSITLSVPKIIYLVGWQYLGHDDKYPAFFEGNKLLKRDNDESAMQSLNWLIEEAKKYNTIVSLHINFSDAYKDSPLWEEYLKNGLIHKTMFNNPKRTGRWNSQNAYQVSFLKEFESGYFQKRLNKLCEIVPLSEIGTVHVDAFFARKAKGISISEEKLGRRKMIEYCMSKGIDVTSEFIYREWKCGHRAHYGKSDIVDLIPAYWHTAVSRKDIIKYPASKLTGSINKGISFDKTMDSLIYGNLKGEDIIGNNMHDWDEKFIKEFATYGLPYLFLNSYKRISIKGILKNRKLLHSENVVSFVHDKKIIKDGKVLKKNGDLCLKIPYLNNTYLGYSETGTENIWYLENGNYNVYLFEDNIKKLVKVVSVKGESMKITPLMNIMYVLEKII